ncbi:uncharacterized protein [Salvelinus sp. IW2-2015]|uniref:uncharacterized protein isoform X2 n=1 Tax=Salvelinus sp. IW2-2015 TaxID=2691554 RepID=UPI0038D3ED11
MANCMVFHTQIASIMEVLANAAVAEICKLVDDDYAVFRLEITQSRKENSSLRRKLQLLDLKVARERSLASRPSIDKILNRNRGMARGEGHFTGGHRSFVKPARDNTWRDDQPITVDDGSGTSTQDIIVIEPAEVAVPGMKQEGSEREEAPRHSRNIQTGVAGVPHEATEDSTTVPAPPRPRTQRSITEGSRPSVHVDGAFRFTRPFRSGIELKGPRLKEGEQHQAIVKRNGSSACSVTKASAALRRWRPTRGSTQERNPSAAPSVTCASPTRRA